MSPSSKGKQYNRRENERSNEIDRHASNSPLYSNNSPRNQSLEFSRSVSSPPDYDFDQQGDAEDENRNLLVTLTASNGEDQIPTTSPVVLDVSMNNDVHDSSEGKNEEEYNESEDILSTQLDDLFSFDTSPKSTKSPAFISSSTSPTTQDTAKREPNGKSPSPENKRIDQINPIVVQVPEKVTTEGIKKTPRATSLLSFLQAKSTNLSSPTLNALNLTEDEEYIEILPTKHTKQMDNEETEEEDIDDAGLDELDVIAYEEEVENEKSIEGSDHDEFDLHPNHPHYRSPYEIPRSVNLPFSPHPSFLMDPQSKHSLFKKQEKPSIYDVRSPIHSQLVAQADPLEEERRKQHSANHDIVVAAKKKFAVEDELDEVVDHYLQEYEEEVLRDQDEDVDLDDDFIPPPPPPEDDDDYVEQEDEEEEVEYIDDLQELDIDEEYENYDDARETDDYISPKNPEGGTSNALTNPSHAMSDISDNSESISTEQLIQHFAPKSLPHSSNMLNVGLRSSLQPLTIPIEQEEDHNTHHYRPEEFNSVFHDIHQDINRMTDVFSPTAMQGVLSPFPMDKSITNEDIG